MASCTLFGISASVHSLFIRYGRRILLHILSKDPKAAITMPSDEEIKSFQESFKARYEMLKNF